MPEGILRSAYEALGHGDPAPLLDLLPEDFEWVEPSLAGYPLSGVHRGAEGFATGVLTPLAELLEGLTFELGDVVVGAAREVVTGVMRGTPAGAGAEWELPFAHVWELGPGGACVRAVGYFDRSRLTLAAGRRQLADVADELLDQAAEIRLQWSRLGDALRAAGVEGADDSGVPDGAPPAASGAGSARLVAVDMVQEGSSREEVAAYLREELGVEDAEAEAILEEAFAEPDPHADLPLDQRPGSLDPSRLTRLFARNRG